MVSTVKELAEELLANLQIDSKVAVTETDGVFNVNIETPESGLLIGFHGEALSSFQLILGLMVYKKLGQWTKIVVEVGDYRAKREEQLTAQALAYAEQVLSSGQPITLPPLPPSERRIIHLVLQDNPKLETLSEGEGNQRRVIIKPK